jgi:hypothetical protein
MIDNSNANPMHAWSVGASLAALNWQVCGAAACCVVTAAAANVGEGTAAAGVIAAALRQVSANALDNTFCLLQAVSQI